MGVFRLILAWLVVAGHTQGYWDFCFIQIGTVAVATFFFISGYLMPLTFNTHYAQYGFSAGSRRFYINRFLRIYPIYWISLAAILLGKFLVGQGVLGGHALRHEFSNPTVYIQNFALLGINQSALWGSDLLFNVPAWSLDVELQYYLLVPIIVLLAIRFHKALLTILAILSMVSIYLYLNHYLTLEANDINPSLIGWSFFFFLGYVFYESDQIQKIISDNWIRVWITVSALFIVANTLHSLRVTPLVFTLGFLLASASLLVAQKENRFGALDKFAGDLSYPIYILHIGILGMTNNLYAHLSGIGINYRFTIVLLVNMFLSTAIAYVVLRITDGPIERLRARIRG